MLSEEILLVTNWLQKLWQFVKLNYLPNFRPLCFDNQWNVNQKNTDENDDNMDPVP